MDKNDEILSGLFGNIDFGQDTLVKICNESRSEKIIGPGSTDNFRANDYLVDMDANIRSDTRSIGFYDTLTSCHPIGKFYTANMRPEEWHDLPLGIYIVQVVYENESRMRMTETGSVLLIR